MYSLIFLHKRIIQFAEKISAAVYVQMYRKKLNGFMRRETEQKIEGCVNMVLKLTDVFVLSRPLQKHFVPALHFLTG